MSLAANVFTPSWGLRRQKRVGIGRLAVTISLPERAAERLTTSFPYRRIVRPLAYGAFGRLRGLVPHGRVAGGGGLISAVAPSHAHLDRRALGLTQAIAPERWYHMIDVGEGVVTPGVVDYRLLAQFVLPASLTRERCVDLCTRDGFWAFEMEARGAAEVVALQRSPVPALRTSVIDGTEDPKAMVSAFAVARELIGSRVTSTPSNDLDGRTTASRFSLIVMDDVFAQLSDPQSELERAFRLCDGMLILIERFDPSLDRYGETQIVEYRGGARRRQRQWWLPGVRALRGMLEMAGFEDVREAIRFPLSQAGEMSQMVVLIAHARPNPKMRDELISEIRESSSPEASTWYHTMQLAPDLVTEGLVDHRELVPSVGLPPSLRGLRCLDVATFDGFWAFEMERRGADEVVAIDVADPADTDIPALLVDEIRGRSRSSMNAGFRAAHQIMRSNVRHEICNVYDLSPDRFGMFDLVFVGDVLVHLRDPQRALDRIRSVCRGKVVLADVYAPGLDAVRGRSVAQRLRWKPGAYFWWAPGASTLKDMLEVAGFADVREIARVSQRVGSGRVAKVVLHGQAS